MTSLVMSPTDIAFVRDMLDVSGIGYGYDGDNTIKLADASEGSDDARYAEFILARNGVGYGKTREK